ncbi:MAG: hypothetical protein ACRDK4_12210 [Solirubrobacteraceae bacterium]
MSGPRAELIAAGVIAAGAALVVWAYSMAPTSGIKSYDPIFWAGMVLVYLTVAWRALSGRHAVLWLAFLGVFTILPKFWMSPNGPIYFDETAHFALLRETISTGHLFQNTPLLPIGKFYPGMESVAAAIHWLTNLPTWQSALTIIAVAHCLLPVQVYYIARALPISHRWAVVAAIVYAANPSFIYEDVQFAYESVAILLMFTIVRIYVETLAAERSRPRMWRESLATALLLALMSFACVVTHHLTTLTGVGLLLVSALTIGPMSGFLDRKGGLRRIFVRYSPPLMLAGCFALWVALVAPGTWPYLFPHVSQPFNQILRLVGLGHGGGKPLRALFGHSAAPGYERLAAIAAPTLIALAVLFAGIRWLRKHRSQTVFLWSFVLASVYLITLPLTLIGEGAAGAHRTWAATFLGVGVLPVAVATLFALDKRKLWLRRTAATLGTGSLVILLVGNVAAGTPVDYRFPGPYRFGSDTLSVTPETLRYADWVREHVGTGAGVVTDRYTALSLTADASAVTPLQIPGLPVAEIWYNRRPPAPSLMFSLQYQGDDYLAVDTRDSLHHPTEAPLFVPGEPYQVPQLNIARLARWPWLHLLYSSQHYRLYKINFDLYYLWYPFHANGE